VLAEGATATVFALVPMSTCKDCSGSGLCEHQRVRSQCKDCGGSSICEHQRRRSRCKDCRNVNDKTTEKEKGKKG